jgi:hypothetical protein
MPGAAPAGGNRRRRPIPAAAGDDPFGEGDELAARRAKRGDADVAGMRGRDRAYAAAYKAGRAGKPAPDDADEPTRQAWETGAEDRTAPPAEPSNPRSSPAKGSSTSPSPLTRTAGGASRAFPLPIPGEPGGFLLGIVAYTLALNFIQGGAGQVRAWLAAKFLNRVGGASSSAPPAAKPPAPAATYPSPTPRVGAIAPGGPG